MAQRFGAGPERAREPEERPGEVQRGPAELSVSGGARKTRRGSESLGKDLRDPGSPAWLREGLRAPGAAQSGPESPGSGPAARRGRAGPSAPTSLRNSSRVLGFPSIPSYTTSCNRRFFGLVTFTLPVCRPFRAQPGTRCLRQPGPRSNGAVGLAVSPERRHALPPGSLPSFQRRLL